MDDPSRPAAAAADADADAAREPRWPVVAALLAAGALYAALPDVLSVGPRWLLICIVGVLASVSLAAHRLRRHSVEVVLGFLLSSLLTAFMLWSLVLLVRALPSHKEAPVPLLRSAAALWATNVLVFAIWYWRLDAGGPHERDRRRPIGGHTSGAFLFPQMSLDANRPGCEPAADAAPWSPEFVDYLFLAFNTSTALSPTDAPVLSRWAKVLSMTQSVISLTVIVILVGRGVNIL